MQSVPKPERKVSNLFQIRWKEPLGRKECPYMFRWVLVVFGFSIRVHHWLRSDDKRFMHDHPWHFVTFVLDGGYTDVSKIEAPLKTDLKLAENQQVKAISDTEWHLRETLAAGDIKFRRAEHAHYVDVPKCGAWTLLFCWRPVRKWGFWRGKQFFRPLRYFHKYGHPPCSEQ